MNTTIDVGRGLVAWDGFGGAVLVWLLWSVKWPHKYVVLTSIYIYIYIDTYSPGPLQSCTQSSLR